MKIYTNNFLLFFLAFQITLFSQQNLTNNKNNSEQELIYSNSFETPEDTSGWTFSGYISFNSDVQPDGGDKSLYISGGCILRAIYQIKADGYLSSEKLMF